MKRSSKSQAAIITCFLFTAGMLALPIVRADRSSTPSLARIAGPSTKITLHAAGRGAPEVNFVDASDLSEDLHITQGAGLAGRVSASPGITAMVMGDVNEDGMLDVVTTYVGGNLGIRYGEPKGRFGEPVFVALEAAAPNSVLLLDFNMDGHLDMVVGYSDSALVSYYEGTGLGLFAAAKNYEIQGTARALAADDYDQDGYTDLAIATASPASLTVVFGQGPEGLGKSKQFRVWPTNTAIEPVAMRSIDVDGDGLKDLVVAVRGEENGFAVVYGVRGYLFTAPFRTLAGTDVQDMVVADLNRNGKMDLVLSDGASGNLLAYQANNSRKWQLTTTVRVSHTTGAMTTASINGDQYLDLVVVEPSANQVAILLGSTSGEFAAPVQLDVDSAPATVRAARLNHDALDDLTIGKKGNGSVVVTLSEAPRITVNTTRDATDFTNTQIVADLPGPDGRISLREAILAAVHTAGPQTISFNIPATDAGFDGKVFTIPISEKLPDLANDGGTTIDGAAQTIFSGDTNAAGPEVVLDGSTAGFIDGVVVTSSVNEIRGLVIRNFQGSGIKIIGSATGNVVSGCYIGTDETGTKAAGNGLFGVLITGNGSQANIIGGTERASRNVISGNHGSGIELGWPTFDNQIMGNYVGVDSTGMRPLGNGADGVFVSGVRNNTIGGALAGAGNLISGNARHGVEIIDGSSNQLGGNLIGTNRLGAASVGNGGDGVAMTGPNSGVTSNIIGGMSVGARNVISGNSGNGINAARGIANIITGNFVGSTIDGKAPLPNGGDGVALSSGSERNIVGGNLAGSSNLISGNAGNGVSISLNSINNRVLGNIIGLNLEGTGALGNGNDGVAINGGGNNLIGGPDDHSRNFISANGGDGVEIVNSANNQVQGNFVGTDRAGTGVFGNNAHGVLVVLGSSNSTVARNMLAYNGGAGVRVVSDAGGNKITRNSMFANSGGGIDRAGAGVLPVIAAILNNGDGTVKVNGLYPATAARAGMIEVFRADPADPAGRGQGRTFLDEVRPDSNGKFSKVLAGVADGEVLTLTATDATNSTSEFSANFLVDMTPPIVTVLVPNGGESIRSGGTFTLRWDASDNVALTSFDLMLSSDGGATYATTVMTGIPGDKRSLTWSVPANLITDNARLRVIARDAATIQGIAQSESNANVTPGAPQVTVQSPEAGSVYRANSKVTCGWQSNDDVGVQAHEIRLSTDGGRTYPTVLTSGLAGDAQSWVWTVPEMKSSATVKIRVSAKDGSGYVSLDESPGTFLVDTRPPEVAVVSPVGGEVLRSGTTVKLQWNASDDLGIASQDLWLSTNGGVQYGYQIVAGLAGDARSYEWKIPADLASQQARLRIIARDRASNEGSKDSNSTFYIRRREPVVLIGALPNNNVLLGGQTAMITWTAYDDVGVVSQDVDLSLDGGATYPITVVHGLAGESQSFAMPVPNNVSTRTARLRVTARDADGLQGVAVSSTNLMIDAAAPSVRLVAPAGGEVLQGGAQFTIAWVASDDLGVDSVTLQLSTDSGATYPNVIAAVPSSSQSFNWVVPSNISSTTAKVRVIARDLAGRTSQFDQPTTMTLRPIDKEPPSVQMVYPLGGEIVKAGSAMQVRWVASDNYGVSSQDVLFSMDDGASFTTLSAGLPGSNESFTFSLPPNKGSLKARLRVRVRDAAGNLAQADTISVFAIDVEAPKVSVTAPSGGELFLYAGVPVLVKWTGSDDTGIVSYDLLLSADGGTTYSPIPKASGLPGTTTSFAWHPASGMSTGRARIRVVAHDAVGNTTSADNGRTFTVISLW